MQEYLSTSILYFLDCSTRNIQLFRLEFTKDRMRKIEFIYPYKLVIQKYHLAKHH